MIFTRLDPLREFAIVVVRSDVNASMPFFRLIFTRNPGPHDPGPHNPGT